MDQNRLNNLLLLISTSLIAAGCSDDGGAGLTAGSTGDDGGNTTGDSADSLTSSPTASASASGATTSPTSTSEPTTSVSTTDETTSPTEGSTSDPSDTEGTSEPTTGESTGSGTTEPTTTGETTEGTTEPTGTGTTTEGTTGMGSEACAGYAEIYAECFYDGDPEVQAAYEAQCNGALDQLGDLYGDECVAALEEVLVCIGGLECNDLPIEDSGSCPDEIGAAMAACN